MNVDDADLDAIHHTSHEFYSKKENLRQTAAYQESRKKDSLQGDMFLFVGCLGRLGLNIRKLMTRAARNYCSAILILEKNEKKLKRR